MGSRGSKGAARAMAAKKVKRRNLASMLCDVGVRDTQSVKIDKCGSQRCLEKCWVVGENLQRELAIIAQIYSNDTGWAGSPCPIVLPTAPSLDAVVMRISV